ncbi:uncharacterized protein FMAN_07524 [Fusarium mangiferae]|uniref:Uncharacterized protein n=1 Tax=Fusarium mangiferae TaxID=192010 RepID=A0A1L7TBF4_FUSMA|nr:uncharacterized protein FMAN_07524 [Fusarium mangiferae]CVK92631.1 uncharacterized protein FMAN_07524 [Fusarium mangiferae]
MIRLYILLWLLPCLFLTTPFTHAALLPRLKASFRLPGVVFSEPVARSFKVVPFKELPGESHHGHGLRQTLGLVKRLVEDQGDMVEVTEEALQELLDQINKLHEQVNSMMPSGATDKQPTQGTGTSSGGQSGQSDQLPAGSSDEFTGSEQSDEPVPSGKASVSIPGVASDPSEAPVVSDPSLRSPLLSQADAATIVESQAPGAPAQLHASQIDTSRQAKTDLVQPAANPTQVLLERGTSWNQVAVPRMLLLNRLVKFRLRREHNSAQHKMSNQQRKERPKILVSPLPSRLLRLAVLRLGGHLLSIPMMLSRRSRPVSALVGRLVPQQRRRPRGHLVPKMTSVLTNRIESASEPAQDTTITVVLVPTPEANLSKASATESGTQITEDSPATAKAEGAAPALETEATSTPDINAGDSQQLAAPTLLSNPSAVPRPEPTALSLRTLVFTSVLTRSSTILATTVRTEFVNANQPTASLKAPGHVFKEDEDTDTNAAFNKGGKLALEESVNKESTPETLRGTPLALETKAILTTTTTTISLSHVDVMTTPEPSQEARSIYSPSSHDAGGINETFHATPNSGFRTIPRSSASLAERA